MLVKFRSLNDHLSGKELFIRFTTRAFRKQLPIYVLTYFPFGFEGRIWDLIYHFTSSEPEYRLALVEHTLMKISEYIHYGNFSVLTR